LSADVVGIGRAPRLVAAGVAVVFGLWLGACQQEMASQPRYEPLEKSEFFEDQRASRPLVEGTLARGALRDDDLLYRGVVNGRSADIFPFPVDRRVLARGQERYEIYCVPCHDRIGTGQGMIVRRGFKPPPSFHSERLRRTEAGKFFEHITRGVGAMPAYAEQIAPEDRWAVVAYIRALQLSQSARWSELSDSERQQLESQK
jgi:hypothetical protein